MKKLITSFGYALNGITNAIITEQNFKIEITCAICCAGLGLYCNISNIEWLVILLNISFVLTMELVNTAIEKSCNLFSTEKNISIKIIKDLSAGATLICAAVACVSGAIIFIPKILNL
jgi:diacylglycerol kinase